GGGAAGGHAASGVDTFSASAPPLLPSAPAGGGNHGSGNGGASGGGQDNGLPSEPPAESPTPTPDTPSTGSGNGQ
ncbi:hypothetical protein F3J11_38570, partial [Burkholderia sp. Cy-647]|nr:hypothetical protein [Burkholderia sp. Cy-647]